MKARTLPLRLPILRSRGNRRVVRGGLWSQVHRLGQKDSQVADLGDMRHLVPCDHAAYIKQGEAATSRGR